MLILVLHRWLPKLPAVLIMVVLAIVSTTVFSLATTASAWSGCCRKGARR